MINIPMLTVTTNQMLTLGIVIGSIFLILILILIFKYGWLYIQALASDAHVEILQLIGMTFRRVNARAIVESRIMAKKAGLDYGTPQLEAHYLARGNVPSVVRALIAADKAKIDLGFDRACAIDLAGRDVLDAVRTSVNPKVIDCPDPAKGKQTIDAVARDGIQLKAKARVTVRANIERLVGGATEETISIDIADIDVGDNIGAKLQADQAEADKRVAQAEAEKRRAMAVAREQEMTALVEENRAKVVLAEADIPKAISQAFREGNLGIMDYYHLKNIQADTDMRSSISKTSGDSTKT